MAALIHIGNAVARQAMETEELFFGRGFYVSHEVRDELAFARGYRDGDRVDLHGARTSRLLDQGAG